MPRKKALSQLSKAYQSTYFDWQEADGLRKYLHKLTLFLPYPQWIQRAYPKKGLLLAYGASGLEYDDWLKVGQALHHQC